MTISAADAANLAHENESLRESLAELNRALARDERGWEKLDTGANGEFTEKARKVMLDRCRAVAVANPLMKRGLQVRAGYIWGQGVQVAATLGGAPHEGLTSLLADFDRLNEATLTSSHACEELERALGTDGEVFLAAFTDPQTGAVRVRSTPAHEITRVITNPEDRDEPWFYIRSHTTQKVTPAKAGAAVETREVCTAHPALGWRPASKVKALTLDGETNPVPVRWEAPILHIPVNRLDGWERGVPDLLAAESWARAYKDFLTDWARLTKSLSLFAWRTTSDTRGKAQQAALRATAAEAGQGVSLGPGQSLEAIPKTGATIDADSGKPLAAMAAAGVGLPVTMLLADPGVTGARATAETLDRPTILEMGMRRMLWQGARTRLLNHVVEAAVEAPAGRLSGTTLIDEWGQKQTRLDGEHTPVFEWTWPPLADLDPAVIVRSIAEADGTQKMPPLVTLRLLLNALGVADADQVLADHTDADGAWIDPDASAGKAAVDAFRRGADAAESLR